LTFQVELRAGTLGLADANRHETGIVQSEDIFIRFVIPDVEGTCTA
jgi:hypothetical protein